MAYQQAQTYHHQQPYQQYQTYHHQQPYQQQYQTYHQQQPYQQYQTYHQQQPYQQQYQTYHHQQPYQQQQQQQQQPYQQQQQPHQPSVDLPKSDPWHAKFFPFSGETKQLADFICDSCLSLSSGVGVLACIPATAPFVLGLEGVCLFVSVAAGAWSIYRASDELSHRAARGESINPFQAPWEWLKMADGVVGLLSPLKNSIMEGIKSSLRNETVLEFLKPSQEPNPSWFWRMVDSVKTKISDWLQPSTKTPDEKSWSETLWAWLSFGENSKSAIQSGSKYLNG